MTAAQSLRSPFGESAQFADRAGVGLDSPGGQVFAVLVAEHVREVADEGLGGREFFASRGDRSVIWAMLRNPAYAGTAVFGKTMAVHQPAADILGDLGQRL